MNADRLLALYENVAEAPDAVARLRRFVLDLAVRGKLVAQDASDEPASELLQRIAAEKAQLVKAGKIKRPKASEPIEPDDLPFDLPQSWLWVRLSDILTKLTDGTHHSPPNGPEGDFLYITAKNIKDDGVKLDDVSYVSRKIHEEIYTRCDPEPGDILYIKDGATTGIVTVNNLDKHFSMLSSVALLKLPVCVFNRLIVVFLRSPFFYEQMRSFMKGAAITRVTLKRMEPALLPLPPLPEQRRIVAKVEELRTLLDRLEAARRQREATRDRLTAASLARLTAPDTQASSGKVGTGFPSDDATNRNPADFPANARFALATLPALTTRSDQIKPLRQTILNLAVRGKLVAQDASDEPASELLKRIATAKAAAKRETGDARIKPAPSPDPDALPMELPRRWSVDSFENLFLFIDYRGKTPPKTTQGIPLITAKNVRMGSLNRAPREFIAEKTFAAWMTRGFPQLGDLFFTTEAPLANICINDIEEPFALAQRVICFQPYAEIDTRYLMFAMMSEVIQGLIEDHSTGLTAKGIKAAKLKPLPLPIPPLAEQHRIVAKVDALMALCDRLEAALTTTDTTRARLLEALLHEALEPSSDMITEAAE